MKLIACAAAAVLIACSAAPIVPVDSLDPADAAPERRRLGMNDVTMLLPLPADPAVPVLLAVAGADHPPLIDHFHLEAIVAPDIGPLSGANVPYASFHVVAVRFDLCARDALGPCADGDDGRLRLVLQPVYRTSAGEIFAHDIGLHAFYPIPAAELPTVVQELRALARLQDAPLATPLMVNPATAASAPDRAYVDRLRALVLRYAHEDRLVRLTALGQHLQTVAFAWVLRGADLVGGQLVLSPIATLDGANRQLARLGGGDTIYATEPVADMPPGFATAINGALFGAATLEEQRQALESLVAIQNPITHGTVNTQCLGCHVATVLTARRAAALGVDPLAMPGRFTSTYDLTVDTIAGTDARVVRGLGWAAKFPAISQRVANDTAQVLTELEARFPPPP